MNEGLQAIAHPHRLSILRAVCEQGRTVNELAELTGLRQPTTSQHLKVLRDAALVSARKEGNRRIYSANPEKLEALRAYLDEFWSTNLLALKVAAEKRARSLESKK